MRALRPMAEAIERLLSRQALDAASGVAVVWLHGLGDTGAP